MIDFIKSMNISIDYKKVLDNQYLEFLGEYNRNTSEIYEDKLTSKKYNDLVIEIIKSSANPHYYYINLKGSLHKYFNNGSHNHNDFFYNNLLDVVIDLFNKFQINPLNVPINNLEFGVNVRLPFRPINFIKRNLLTYKNTMPKISTFSGNGYSCEFEFSQHSVKIYDKGMQDDLNNNVLRFEINVSKMQYLKSKGIHIKNLFDLLNLSNLKELSKLLLSTFKDILIIDDDLDTNLLSERQKDFYLSFKNRITQVSEFSQNKRKFYKKKDRFNKLLEKFKQTNIKNKIYNLIEKKINELLKIDTKTGDKFTTFKNLICNETGDKFTTFKNNQNQKRGQIYTSNIELNCPSNKEERFCNVTGLKITNQREKSKFLSISGLKEIYKTNPEQFKELKFQFLTKKWNNEPLKVQINEIAHNIRNKYFNGKYNVKNKYEKLINDNNTIFNNFDLIDNGKLKYYSIDSI